MQARQRVSGSGWAVAGCASVLLVCLPLFFRTLGRGVNNDWPNHCWMVNYCARFFAVHHSFPHVFNTDQLMGMAFPVFYGYLFFPSISVFSTVLDANITLRVFAAIALAGQFFLVYRSATHFLKDRLFAFTLASIVTWAIYPLTNLYHRAAVPEFFACTSLVCASVAWLRALQADSKHGLYLWSNLAVLCLCAAAGTHPITAVYGVFSFALLIMCSLIFRPRLALGQVLGAVGVPALIGLLCLSPWLISAHRYSKDFQIADSFNQVGYFMQSVDSLSLRLSPLPPTYSMLERESAVDHMTCHHLDAQINIPLALLCVACALGLWRRKQLDWRLGVILLTYTLAALWLIHISTTFGAISRLGHLARCLQFAYRLVTYINLCLLANVLFCAVQVARNRGGEAERALVERPILLAILLVSAVAATLKVSYAFELAPLETNILSSQRSDEAILQLPSTFYGFQNYGMPRILDDLSAKTVQTAPKIAIKPQTGANFGMPTAVVLDSVHPGWTGTNLQEFAWNKLSVNGSELTSKQLGAYKLQIVARDLPQGLLSYDFVPSTSWAVLDRGAVWAFLLWIAASIAVSTWLNRRARRLDSTDADAVGTVEQRLTLNS